MNSLLVLLIFLIAVVSLILAVPTFSTNSETLSSSTTPERWTTTHNEDGQKKCGERMFKYMTAICGQCEPGTNENIATNCCEFGCSVEKVKRACCPHLLP
ncbi:unnamed protein product [Caenorhabditis sp. 36 PRJEB53466]|nr:unnamed protein product [Caenorhabditis sp. 36 PRJEB53466]